MKARPLAERTHVVFVRRIGLAEELATFVNDELGIPAAATCGSDPDFYDKQRALSSGAIRMLVGCLKPLEGFDVVEVDAVWPIWPLGWSSEWMLRQQVGRGSRLDPSRPGADFIVIDPLFIAGSHQVASILGYFGQSTIYNGATLAPSELRDLEAKIFGLLNRGFRMSENV